MKNKEAHLFSLEIKTNEITQVFPYSYFGLMSTYYPNLVYDVNDQYFIVLEKYGREIEVGSQLIYLSAFPKKEPLQQVWLKRPVDKNEISHNLTGIHDMFFKRIVGSPRDYWHYDLILQKDETLLMPIAYKDSLYLYLFTDKAWTKDNYQGAEINKEHDK